MNRNTSRGAIGSMTLLAAVLCGSEGAGNGWLDNNRKFKSDDPQYHFRRSEHFRLIWGRGAAKGKDENADFSRMTEEIAQGNLQMLEQIWHLVHDPLPKGLGLRPTGTTSNPKHVDDKRYRTNLMLNNTGIWAGGAWGACDDWGFPLFALPPTWLRVDPPGGATAHEYGHTVLINGGGFNETPYDGMWHEATANWIQLQHSNSHPGTGGVGTQPYLSLPHGRNYYDTWQIWECFREDPRYGSGFIAKLWTEAKGNKAKGAEYMFDAMVRMDPTGSPDPYNSIKDVIGRMAARHVTWDYERQVYFVKHCPPTMDPLAEVYRRARTELVRRQGDTTWYRVPFAHAPMQGGYNLVPIALTGKNGGGYSVSVNFQPLWDATRRSDWRATLVAVNDNGGCRYSTMWNGGVNTIVLAADENQLFLTVAATPDFMPFEGFSRPLISEPTLQPQAYEISLVNTKATIHESKPAGVAGKEHPNGGGFVAGTAQVEPTAYVGPNAMVLDKAKVLGNARIEDFAVVRGNATVKENAVISGHALVKDEAQVYGNGKVRDWATLQGRWKVYENGRLLERAYTWDRGELHGNATIKGNTQDFGNANVHGHAIKDGDCSNGANAKHQVLMCWVWGTDQKYADGRPDSGQLYCNFAFKRHSPIYALDTHGVMHGYLMGGARSIALDEAGLPGALFLDGVRQYVELKRDVADFADTTLSVWVNWNGGDPDQRVFHFGDGAGKYAYLTPRDAEGKVRFVLSTNSKTGEQALVGTEALPVGTWTHVAVTLQGDTGTLYVDGKPVATNKAMTLNLDQVLAPNTLSGNDCTFLGRGEKGNYFKGLLSDFRIYVQPQEATTIATLAGAIKNRKAAPVVEAKDTTPPTAATGFLVKPAPAGDTCIVMSAPKGTDDSKWVEYSFSCTEGGGHTSGWISSNRWTDCDLKPGATYAYAFKMRDKSGNETPASAAETATLPVLGAPGAAEFESGPVGISATAIRMAAKNARVPGTFMEYQFARNDGKTSGWQASSVWTDTGLTEGAKFEYTVQMRDVLGRTGPASAAKSAVARDDTPPARYRKGEWATLPYATLNNCVAMRAMSVTGEDGCPKIEPDAVEYFFHCTSGNAPDSGWVAKPSWQTPPLPDGTYTYEFKMRDKSPQKNETPYSSVETAKVSILTGYRELPIAQIATQPEGALVAFKGKVTEVDKDTCTVGVNGTSVKVMNRAVAGATDSALKDKEVTVRGCIWICNGEKRVTWAEVK